MGPFFDLAVNYGGIDGSGIACDWTGSAALEDGDFGRSEAPIKARESQRATRFLRPAKAQRLLRTYRVRFAVFLGQARAFRDLDKNFGHGLCVAEVDYSITHQWAQTDEDILWRQTKFGLGFMAEKATDLDGYITERMAHL